MLEWVIGEWDTMTRIVFIAVTAYILLVLLLRTTGKRTLSKMNAFDLIVTVALGSVLATTIMNDRISLTEGFLGLFMLVGLQFAVTWSSVRIVRIGRIVKSEPTLLYYDGKYLEDNMRKERVMKDEVRHAARVAGKASLDEVSAVVLETDGSMSVLTSRGELIEGKSSRDEENGD